MSPLPPGDRLLTRQSVARSLRWPDGALDACLAIEADYPNWTVFWSRGRGYFPLGFRGAHAAAPDHELWAATAEGMREQAEAVEAELRVRRGQV